MVYQYSMCNRWITEAVYDRKNVAIKIQRHEFIKWECPSTFFICILARYKRLSTRQIISYQSYVLIHFPQTIGKAATNSESCFKYI